MTEIALVSHGIALPLLVTSAGSVGSGGLKTFFQVVETSAVCVGSIVFELVPPSDSHTPDADAIRWFGSDKSDANGDRKDAPPMPVSGGAPGLTTMVCRKSSVVPSTSSPGITQ